ncbi:hypothetical protein PSTG_06077 [Puccinia striiformis f. sp. tritici PST-78]|uniref:Uncharacterized protein n=2 Tax=Puccinia striiformis TaxID=27350 RepID=A0A0L0VN11_9BASI|nr:hypothetical protein PSTG_06077 [Puccinia striiformis f. sp. tritici PST-78]
MATEGYAAYDCTISQPVLVQTVVLCFLADSPMHAEITNTPNPGNALNPCRRCTLSVETRASMKSVLYSLRFLQLDISGRETPNPARSWVKTKNDTYQLFDITMAVHITRFNQFSLVYGVKDTINTRFITESWTNPLLKEKMEALDEHYPVWLYNPIMKLEGFNGVLDTPVELLHVVLLGFVKYLARGDISKLSDTNKSILIARLEAFDSSNLNVGSMKPR